MGDPGSVAPCVDPLHRLPFQPCANSFLAHWCARLMRVRLEGGDQSQITWFLTRLAGADQATGANKRAKYCLIRKLSETDISTSASGKETLQRRGFPLEV